MNYSKTGKAFQEAAPRRAVGIDRNMKKPPGGGSS
jgi:hypothetical protein